jgi:signal transduction histidine kinase
VRARYAEMRRLQTAWHTAAEQALLPAARSRPPADPLRSDDFEALLLGVARLDEAIGDEIRRTRDHILAADTAQRWTTALLAFAGLAGAGAVALLARRLQRYAAELEARRSELERAGEARARLMRGISHDVKNPMHAIDGHAALLGDGLLGPLSAEQAHSVARIRRGVRSVVALVDDLLALSRAEAGQLEVRRQPTDLAALLQETVEEHRAAAWSAGHEVELSIPGGPAAVPTLHTDPERVRQVLGNLLSNAVKYTPSGGHIAVRAERRARSAGPPPPAAPNGAGSNGAGARPRDGWMAIDVVDSGPGIPPDKLDVIFDEFARLPAHAGMPGSGLGLAIARRVARLLGGELTAATEPRGGARFTLWLPGD